jgi:hypothetical protein
MLKMVLIALVVVAGLYFLVAKTKIEAIGFSELKRGQPDTVLGVVVIVLTLALMAFLLFVPPREGASLSSRIYLSGFALLGLAWGIDQLRRSRIRRRHKSH